MKRITSFVAFLAYFAFTAASAAPGDSRVLLDKDVGGVNGMAALGDKLYLAGPQAITEVDRAGKTRVLPKPAGDWGRSWRIAAMDGKLYVLNEENLLELDLKGGARQLGKGFGYTAMATMGDKVYVISGRDLYVADKNANVKELTDDWYKIDGMASVGDKLYIINRDILQEVDTAGKPRPLGEAFKSPAAMAASGGKLYVFAWDHSKVRGGEAALYEVDPANGARRQVALPKGWPASQGPIAIAAAADGTVYMALQATPSNTRIYTLSVK
jgi:hypothetical protein